MFGRTVATTATAPVVCTNCGKRMAAARCHFEFTPPNSTWLQLCPMRAAQNVQALALSGCPPQRAPLDIWCMFAWQG